MQFSQSEITRPLDQVLTDTRSDDGRFPAKRCSEFTSYIRRWSQFAVGLCFCVSTSALATDWTIEDLGGQGGATTVGSSINARGQVTGYTYLQNRIHAFYFDGTHNLKFIGTLPTATDSEGYGINVFGQIVGDSGRDSQGLWHAMLYSPSQGMIDLDRTGTYSNGYSSADSINFGGAAVGLGTPFIDGPQIHQILQPSDCPTYVGGGGSRALLWNDTGIHDLESIPSYFPWSAATAINDNGVIVGWSSTVPPGPYGHFEPNPFNPDAPPIVVCDTPPFAYHAAYYANGWHELGALGGTNSMANSINNGGQIVGSSQMSGDAVNHAFLYDGGTMRDINPPEVASSVAIGINNRRQIVGLMGDFGSFFYDRAMRDINAFPEVVAAGWNITGAFAINDSGQITGYGVNSKGQNNAYRMHPQSTSRYVQPTDSTGTIVERARYYALGAAQTNQSGMVVLDFGCPFQDANGHGTVLPPCGSRSKVVHIPDIKAAVFGFLDGYVQAAGSGRLTVAVGTNNYCRPDPTSRMCRRNNVTTAHGQAWGQMMADINAYISSSANYADRLSVVGASDIEPLYSPAAVAQNWVNGYSSTSPVNYINYGSADECPPPGTGSCGKTGWTQNDVWSISWGSAKSDPPVPEIYGTGGANAQQWAALANLNGTLKPIRGALTQWQACIDMKGQGCKGANNTPPRAWQQLMDRLYNANPNNAPTVQPMLYSTDITWQN